MIFQKSRLKTDPDPTAISQFGQDGTWKEAHASDYVPGEFRGTVMVITYPSLQGSSGVPRALGRSFLVSLGDPSGLKQS